MSDLIRIACGVPAVAPGDVAKNTADICRYIKDAEQHGADLLLLPELSLTGYTCGDLFFQDALLHAAQEGLREILACSASYPRLSIVVGLPVRIGGALYNCAALLRDGALLGLVPKTHLAPGESRWFASGSTLSAQATPALDPTIFGEIRPTISRIFDIGGHFRLGIEICEDLMVPSPCSSQLSVAGAEVIVNPAASHALAGKHARRRALIEAQSARCSCIYAFASAGCTESTSDLVFSGHSLIAENGRILAESDSAPCADYLLCMDCDLGRIRGDRARSGSFTGLSGYDISFVQAEKLRSDGALYPLRPYPFVPNDPKACTERCLEIFQMQVAGLKQRLRVVNAAAVLGISGGLDSTLALLVSVEAMRQLGRPATDVYGITMPCFGTSGRTYANSWALMRALGISASEISIKDAVTQHFSDIGHDISVHNGTYENSQARERTQVLMDFAGKVGGLVVGTGDLSELALGWCTYNGDHMAMYGVNATVPKTLIPKIIEAVSALDTFRPARETLADILDTPISPELLPSEGGKIVQKTEEIVGPYALHDFFLFYMLRYGFSPKKIYAMACRAFAGEFDAETVKKWLNVFYRRFFSQQFKRDCAPNGVKIGRIGLGPRGDWSIPSDASARVWLTELEQI